MFFMVELGAVFSAIIVYISFRKDKGAIPKTGKMTVINVLWENNLGFVYQ